MYNLGLMSALHVGLKGVFPFGNVGTIIAFKGRLFSTFEFKVIVFRLVMSIHFITIWTGEPFSS